MDLSALFAPDRVAVVGATDRDGSVGRAVFENLLDGFDGEVVPVNPTRETILGHRCVDGVGDVDADLAVVVVPATAVVDVVREAGEAGYEAAVVVTAGFGETGAEGAARERDLRDVAREYDVALVGPNCLGVISTPRDLNATFAPSSALPGDIAFMSQSGAFVTAVLDWARDRELGFSDVVSLGNKAVLDETDFVRYWGADPDTAVVAGYLEDVDDGRAFIEACRETTRETPVVLVKSGRTEAGARAASSHTGAIAGSEAAYEAALDAAGVVRAESVQELFDAARVLEGQPLPAGDSVAVVTNAGGPGVMATDAVGDADLSLADFESSTLDALGEGLPDEANVYNPVDVLGDADVGRFVAALDAVLEDGNVDAVVVVAAPTATFSFAGLAEELCEQFERHGVPIVACLMGGERARRAAARLDEVGIPNYFDPARAVAGIDVLTRQRRISEREYEEPTTFDVDRDRVRQTLTAAAADGRTRLGVEAMDVLEAYGIPTPAGEVVDSRSAAVEAAADLGEAVVMKIVSPDILHKSDIGGVKVGVDRADVGDAYEDLLARARNYQPDARVLGVQIQEQVDLSAGVETIAGTNRDPQFGPLVLFGLGGIFVEVLEDTSLRVAPVAPDEARAMTEEIRAAPLLRGARGRDPVDRDALAEALQRLSQLVTDFPAILELDVNPLVATPDGAVAVDLRLTISPDDLDTPDQ
jgi:acetyltransferase